MSEYAHPEYLVETDWVTKHMQDPNVRIVESDEDYLLYETGHIPGAAKVDWFTTLQDPVQRNFLSQAAFEELNCRLGISNDTTVIFYGDKNNWFACYTLWLYQLYGHQNLKVMNGGRAKWIKEGRPMTKDVPAFQQTEYHAQPPDLALRAFREEVLQQSNNHHPLVDVRSPQEYTGELLHMANYPQEGATRGGHIPGAVNIPWSKAVDETTGLFKTADELRQIYASIPSSEKVIAYCRIGERSSVTWFVLKYLLGYTNVKNYDGSWTEWGNLVGAPIEKGA